MIKINEPLIFSYQFTAKNSFDSKVVVKPFHFFVQIFSTIYKISFIVSMKNYFF